MQKIKLDISKKLSIPHILAKQGNVGQQFKVAVTDNGSACDLPADAVISAWYSGAGGQGNYSQIGGKSAFQISGNTVTVELIAQMLKKAGDGELCLVINRADGSQIGLWNIPYSVEPIPGADSAGATQHYSALSELIQDIRDTTVPHIGQNGNWWLGETDTGVQAQGEKGEKGDTGAQGEQGIQGEKGDPGEAGADGADGEDGLTPFIGENGNWWIGDTDTGVSAGGSSASVTVDAGLSETSENPVQNKAISAAINDLAESIPDDEYINSLIDAKLEVIENGTY